MARNSVCKTAILFVFGGLAYFGLEVLFRGHSHWTMFALGEATAKAVQRIPDAHCNGDMHAALDYASKVKHAQREVVSRCGIKSIVE